MTSNAHKVGAALAFASLCLAPSASAQFSDNFESYTIGSLEGQGGWAGWDGVTTPVSQVRNDQVYAGSQSISIADGSDTVHDIPGATSGQWVVSTQIYLPSVSSGVFDWLVMNTYQDGGPYEWACYYAFDTTSGLLDFFGGGTTTISPLVYDAWVELRIEVDLDADFASAYYNGALITSWVWTTGYNGAQTHAVAQIDAFDLYTEPGALGEIFFDDMRVTSDSLGTSYCTSNPNSTGAAAQLSAVGSNSIAADDLTLISGPVPNQPSIFFHGGSQISVPFGNGLLCAAGGIVRLSPIVVGAGNVAELDVDMPTSGITPGTRYFQHWFRDPAGGGASFNTSDGVGITFLP